MDPIRRRLLLTGLVFAAGSGFSAYTFFERYRGQTARNRSLDDTQRLFHFGRTDVERGILEARGQVIRIERAGEDWILTAPMRWPADRAAVLAALDNLAGLKIETTVSPAATPEELASYGLAQPSLRFAVELKDGRTAELRVGEKSDLDNRYFVTDGQSRRIGRASDAFAWALDRDVSAFREKRLFPLAPAQILRAAVIKAGAPLFAIARTGPDAPFRVAGNDGAFTADADPAIARRFLLILTRDLKAEAFVSDQFGAGEASAESFGLAAPAFGVEVTELDGQVRRGSVGIGPPGSRQGRGPFFRLEDTPTVVAIYDAFPGDLDRRPDELKLHPKEDGNAP